MATPTKVPGRTYSTFKKAPPKKGYAPGDVLNLKPGQVPRFTEGLGYYAGTKPAAAKKPTVRVVNKASTPQGSFTTIESPDQIEARVKAMAASSFSEQQKTLNDQADRLRKEAEGRRTGLQAAYEAAAKANAGMGLDVQSGWEQAAKTITGLAGTATGGVKDALLADLASQEQALSRVGAGGTGFDATSQANTEYFRGGGIPGEYDTRMGGIGRQWMNEAAQALNARGLQEGIQTENTDRAKINADLMDQVGTLTTNRTKMESDLRTQLLDAQATQAKATQDERKFQADMAIKKVQIEQAQQKINLQYQEAKAKVTTTAQKFALDQWYKQQNVILSNARVGISQQQANISQQNANTSSAKAAAALLPGGGKPPSPSSKTGAIRLANTAGTDAFHQEMTKILAKFPGAHAPAGTAQKDYVNDPKYQAAKAQASHEASVHQFGALMYRVIAKVGPILKNIGYTPTQIKRYAYTIISAEVDPPHTWLQKNPGFGPKV